MTDSTRPWASVVIPIKDERDNLTPLTERVLKVLSAREESNTAPFELIYIDDGSSDGSSELLDRLQQTYPAVRVLHFDRNYGQSSAFDAGFKHSTGEVVITLDGDSSAASPQVETVAGTPSRSRCSSNSCPIVNTGLSAVTGSCGMNAISRPSNSRRASGPNPGRDRPWN